MNRLSKTIGVLMLLIFLATPFTRAAFDDSFWERQEGQTAIQPSDGSPLRIQNYEDLDEISTPTNPNANIGRLFVADDAGTTNLHFLDSAGTDTVITGSGALQNWSSVLSTGNTSGATDAVITAGQKLTTDEIEETTGSAGITFNSTINSENGLVADGVGTATYGGFPTVLDLIGNEANRWTMVMSDVTDATEFMAFWYSPVGDGFLNLYSDIGNTLNLSAHGKLSTNGSLGDLNATPILFLVDSDGADNDDNAHITGNLTDTGSGTEDFDMSLQQQIAGAMTAWLTSDADGDIDFGSGRNVNVSGSFDVGGTIDIVGTIDDDTMATATDTTLATSESIKAYADSIGSASAPVGATYITQVADATLTNEQAMGALATGLVKNTTTTGVQSIAIADTDYLLNIVADTTPQLGGTLDAQSNLISNVLAPVSGTDATNKDYVDSLVQGIVWQEPVIDQLTTPPGGPSTDDRYIVLSVATGAWAGQEDKIAQWSGSAWTFQTPAEAWAVWDQDADMQYTYNGSAWVTFGSTLTHNNTSGLQGGTTNEYYHFTATRHTDLTDGGDSALHYHDTDRARANHTGTQTASTISDFDTEVSNNVDVAANTTHRSSDGSDHTFINQDVTTTGTPTFTSLLFALGTTISEFSIDGTLAGNSDDAVPTEKAVKTYADAIVGGQFDASVCTSGCTYTDIDAALDGGAINLVMLSDITEDSAVSVPSGGFSLHIPKEYTLTMGDNNFTFSAIGDVILRGGGEIDWTFTSGKALFACGSYAASVIDLDGLFIDNNSAVANTMFSQCHDKVTNFVLNPSNANTGGFDVQEDTSYYSNGEIIGGGASSSVIWQSDSSSMSVIDNITFTGTFAANFTAFSILDQSSISNIINVSSQTGIIAPGNANTISNIGVEGSGSWQINMTVQTNVTLNNIVTGSSTGGIDVGAADQISISNAQLIRTLDMSDAGASNVQISNARIATAVTFAGDRHKLTNVDFLGGATVSSGADDNGFFNSQFGADGGAGALTLTIASGANRTRMSQIMVDAAVSDSGTDTAGSYVIY